MDYQNNYAWNLGNFKSIDLFTSETTHWTDVMMIGKELVFNEMSVFDFLSSIWKFCKIRFPTLETYPVRNQVSRLPQSRWLLSDPWVKKRLITSKNHSMETLVEEKNCVVSRKVESEFRNESMYFADSGTFVI